MAFLVSPTTVFVFDCYQQHRVNCWQRKVGTEHESFYFSSFHWNLIVLRMDDFHNLLFVFVDWQSVSKTCLDVHDVGVLLDASDRQWIEGCHVFEMARCDAAWQR